LDAIKEADVADRVRESAATIHQALIEAELTSVIGAEPHERTDCTSRSCGTARSSRRCSSGAGSTRRFMPS